ncbi:MAG: hypothetical protein GX824_03700 [Clostridiales bacterium]|nr:hypothetical protein [Clostridiales bacterium]
MKRISIIFLALIFMFFAASCANDELADAYVFIERFNNIYSGNKIELEHMTSTKSEDGREYSINIYTENPNDIFLITLYSDTNGSIKKCSITMKNNNAEKNKAPDQSTLLRYKWVLVSACAAYTKDSIENVETILTDFGTESQDINKVIGTQYKETQQFRYAYTANNIGASLSIESVRLMPKTENYLTLKNKSD